MNLQLLNIPPGIYTVRKSYVGYGTLVIEQVEVFSNRTNLPEFRNAGRGPFRPKKLLLTAERPIVQRDRTSTATYLQRELLKSFPFNDSMIWVRFQPGGCSYR